MCTAITYNSDNLYFGRTLDNDFHFHEEVTITPRNYDFKFKNFGSFNNTYAIIGMAYNLEDFPLYYDAVNESGLCIAGLNFPENAKYNKPKSDVKNIAQFELIPYILGKCKDLSEARALLKEINITDTKFNENLPVAELHWLIADKRGVITVESVSDGLKIYENPVGVLANNPVFPEHLSRLNDYMYLSADDPVNKFAPNLDLKVYCKGMGAIGLPGDFSSISRFVRAAFVKLNSVLEDSNERNVNQFFHILGTVSQTKGCCKTELGYEVTQYISCCNADMGIYYYTTYEDPQIKSVNLYNENLNGNKIISYPIMSDLKIQQIN